MSHFIKGLLATAAATVCVSAALAQATPPNPAVSPGGTAAGQRSSQNTPMGTTGTPTGSGGMATGAAGTGTTGGMAATTPPVGSASTMSGSTAGSSPTMAADTGGSTQVARAGKTRKARADRN